MGFGSKSCKKYLCVDGHCVDQESQCAGRSEKVYRPCVSPQKKNHCLEPHGYKCPNGLCVIKDSQCPRSCYNGPEPETYNTRCTGESRYWFECYKDSSSCPITCDYNLARCNKNMCSSHARACVKKEFIECIPEIFPGFKRCYDGTYRKVCPEPPKDNTGGIIAGISTVVFLIFVFLCWMCRRPRRRSLPATAPPAYDDAPPTYAAPQNSDRLNELLAVTAADGTGNGVTGTGTPSPNGFRSPVFGKRNADGIHVCHDRDAESCNVWTLGNPEIQSPATNSRSRIVNVDDIGEQFVEPWERSPGMSRRQNSEESQGQGQFNDGYISSDSRLDSLELPPRSSRVVDSSWRPPPPPSDDDRRAGLFGLPMAPSYRNEDLPPSYDEIMLQGNM